MLRFLFYANFDNKVGPQLPICVPHPFISLKEFNEIDKYILPKRSLSHHLLSFHWKGNIILNFPIRIEDAKYERHAFFFSFGMVLRKNEHPHNHSPNSLDEGTQSVEAHKLKAAPSKTQGIEIESYERILKRLTLIFLALEKDFLYLSKHNKHDHYPLHFKYLQRSSSMSSLPKKSRTSSKSMHTAFNLSADRDAEDDAGDYLLRNVLLKIYDEFKTTGECTVNLIESRKIALKLCNKLSSPADIHVHDVPVLICDLSNCIDHRWDIALQCVLQQINSVNHVKRICDILKYKLNDAAIDEDAVTECIRQLLYYKYVVLADIFKYNNLYITTKNVQNLMQNAEMQQSALSFLSFHDGDDDDEEEDDVDLLASSSEEDEGKAREDEDADSGGDGMEEEQTECDEDAVIKKLYVMFNKFDGQMTVKQLMQQCEWKKDEILQHCEIQKFVLFGTVNKLIRRIHRYPTIVDPTESAEIVSKMSANTFFYRDKLQKLVSLCDGTHCFDEICCELDLNQKEIKKLLNDVEYVVLLK